MNHRPAPSALGALWRRTVTYLPRELAALSRRSVRALRSQVRMTYAKVAEFQARGVVHVHAVIRLDGPDGPETAPSARVSVTVEGSNGRELVVRWGEQIDVRPISLDLQAGGVSQTAVAGYIAKYATKDAQVAGGLDRRVRYIRQIELADVTEHARRLMSSAWSVSPRWAHSFGFRGHFLTKGRRYPVTFRALRGARAGCRRPATVDFGELEMSTIKTRAYPPLRSNASTMLAGAQATNLLPGSITQAAYDS